MDYKKAGVDIEKADILTGMIKNSVKNENIGMFAGLYENPVFDDYYLVGCADGVGTKLIPLIAQNKSENAAIDLIAMNLNDMVCTGAKPLFFLDYIAVNTLDVEIISKFVSTLKKELDKYNCTLLGGETAELKGLICKNRFDVGGFAIGAVKKNRLLKKENIKENDIVIGLCSSGPHSNGFTLIRKLYEEKLISEEYMQKALEPTYIYVNEIIELVDNNLIKGCANITGGGIEGNLNRIIPENLCAEIKKETIPKQKLFENIKKAIDEKEAYKTFNMGVGMCIICSEKDKDKIYQVCKKYNPFEFGRIIKNEEGNNIRLR